MSRRLLTLLTVLVTALAVLAPAGAEEAPALPDGLSVPDSVVRDINSSKVQTYIVQMADRPVVAYDGGIAGYSATKPKNGKKINPNSNKVANYVGYLNASHGAALGRSGGTLVYDYAYSFNGFAARLTGNQAAALAADPSVMAVTPDELMHIDTISSSDFLELNASGGIWDQVGGSADAGEGVIVGIIDTGIWPENPSFSDRSGTNSSGKEGKLDYHQIPGWHGKCVPGEDFAASSCNQKVIGAQWFNAGYGGDAGIAALFPNDFLSARDGDGHGSHTASTAAGNYNTPVSIDGIDLGTASGMAPRARIAAYKVCWGGDDGGCFGSDSVAAIDQAVADGVDVLNFSISGSRTSVLDPVEVAFLFAADAGIFVAASAGNAGPGASTVAHNSPWLTTVAAGTHDRFYAGTGVTGEQVSYDGAMFDDGPVSGNFVYSGDVALVMPASLAAQQCQTGTLDPALVAGNIVLCDRGAVARVEKSAEVASAGGIGMVHANVAPSSINADFHSVPTLHVNVADGDALRAYAMTAGATITLEGGVLEAAEAPDVAGFSSRGPALASGDLLKPDIMAPGVDIIAAVSPPFNNGENYGALSGTSMSSPHIAGIGALMKDAHPDWSPAMIKSALMTTASQTTNKDNPIAGNPFGYGAGHVVPNAATDPGLVYDAGWNDWLNFIFESDAAGNPFDKSDLNYPSIAIGDLVGSQTVTRTVTNVGPSATYHVSVDAPAGVDVDVSPSSITVASGATASYTVTFTVTPAAALDSYAFGSLTWSHGPHNVRSPLVVKPVKLSAPSDASGSGTDGSTSWNIGFGYEGDFAAAVAGLVPADAQDGNVLDDPANDINVALGTGLGITVHGVVIPAGSSLARFSLFDDFTDGNDDLDLYVFNSVGAFVAGSGSGTSNEQVDVVNPTDTFYFVIVHGWQTDGADSNYTLFGWGVNGDAGNMTVTGPGAATLGDSGLIEVTWTGLTAGIKYLGEVHYIEGGSVFQTTTVAIDG